MDLSQEGKTDSIFRQLTGFCRLSFFCSILLPYIPLSMRQPLLLFTKFLELKECMSCPRKRFDFGHTQAADSADAISDIFTKLSPFLSEQERAQFSQMQNMMQMLKLYQTFQELAPLMNMGGDGMPSPETLAAAWASMGNGNPKNDNPQDKNPQDKNPQGQPSFDGSGMTDMLFSMLSPDQKEMFENLKTVMSEPPAE